MAHKKYKGDMDVISLYLNIDKYNKVRDFANKNNTSISFLVNKFLEDFINEKKIK